MSFTVNKSLAMPAYEQLCNWLERQIREGVLRIDDKLPAERVLAEQLGIARNTVKQAYACLCDRGFAKTIKGSGSYVCEYSQQESTGAEKIIRDTVEKLKQMGVGRREAERLFVENAWKNIPKSERLRVAWVDCSPELLQNNKTELENFCNIRVDTYALDHIRESPRVLRGQGYSMIATTINHYDEIKECVQQVWEGGPMPAVEKVVLALGPNVISKLVQIQKQNAVAVIYDTEWFRYSVECFLSEFGKDGNCEYMTLDDAKRLIGEKRTLPYNWLILPPDPAYRDGMVSDLAKALTDRRIPYFCFEQNADQGSLYHVKRRAQAVWWDCGTE